MSHTLPAPPVPSASGELSPSLLLLFAAACGLLVANIYYAQPLIGLIAPDLGLPDSLAGIVVACAQLGYGVGLLMLVPLADCVENRRLVLILLGGVVASLVAIAASTAAWSFLAATLTLGLCAAAAQILVPLASQLAAPAHRGRVVGNVMAGLLAGIMLARPLASVLAQWGGWRAVFVVSTVLVCALAVALGRKLPRRAPQAGLSYGAILRSMPGLLARNPLLRRRAFYQAMMFAAFTAFWTATPLLLVEQFGFGQYGIAAFALCGAAGALVAPLAGRLADRGLTRAGTFGALACVTLSFAATGWAGQASTVLWLALAAIGIDAAVQVCQVLSLRAIFMLAPEQRGRLNALFMTSVFVGGACGSTLAGALYAAYGWHGVALLGSAFGLAALALFATEGRARPLPAADGARRQAQSR
ncbi:MFS transporter [Verticiella sediminum]|uniref:MFS transporter n=1 Tax=Verticiella sediminum TaxID=1247510 RepID=A0A556A7P0_9BURK|nr:MFS transporter [Verticiella sediminum]TSH88899.1 MFS transporter [Verticiella sediminum]